MVQNLHSQKTHHTSSVRARYGAFFVSTAVKVTVRYRAGTVSTYGAILDIAASYVISMKKIQVAKNPTALDLNRCLVLWMNTLDIL